MIAALIFAAQLVAWAVFVSGCGGLAWVAWVLAEPGRRQRVAGWVRWQVRNRQE